VKTVLKIGGRCNGDGRVHVSHARQGETYTVNCAWQFADNVPIFWLTDMMST